MKPVQALPYATDAQRLALIDGKKWSAAEVQRAALVKADTLTNYLSKNRLRLASVSDGPGRPRQFCTVDVYQLALMNRLVELTRRPEWAARTVEIMLFEDVIHRAHHEIIGSDADDALFRTMSAASKINGDLVNLDEHSKAKGTLEAACVAFCTSLSKCPPMYTHRDIENPFVVYFAPEYISAKPPIYEFTLRLGTPPYNPDRYDQDMRIAPVAGLYVNLTWLFTMVDRDLEQLLIERSRRPDTDTTRTSA
ncbi:hypothetical protein GGR25_001092 [Kaistia hirudinis]|uniref:Uncharacterized protein n=1 Tax=Kaistia hirudinis TaxID=1293440 RepID=A0A840ALC0_9HYPH|nr:hypothetical protein [Kaistia hirudinis]MBB3930053.1 hypothetical protein [Kaistia hirudinis]